MKRMAMARNMKSLATAVLLLCTLSMLFASNCDAKGLHQRVVGSRIRKPGGRSRRDPSEKVFNVLNFGAKPGGRKDCSESFIRAWNAACNTKGRARLVIPNGIFMTGPVVFQGPCSVTSPIIVQIMGTVKALSDPTSYEEDFWISFERVNGLVVTGTGTIDGQGSSVWKYNNCAGGDGGQCGTFPSSIKFSHVTNGIIRLIKSLNPMGFHIAIVQSQNIKARNLHITAPANSPNTDGIHISQSSMVKVARSVIATGDDCVGIIQGCTDVSIKKVTCGPGHGISIGSLGKYPDEKDVRGVVVENCTLQGTQNGIRIKTYGGSIRSQASGITFNNIVMENVKNPIIIDQNYGSKSKGPSHVKISDVHMTNIRGTSASKVGVNLMCSSMAPCDRIQLANINLKYTGLGRNRPFTSICSYARPSYSGVQFPRPCK